jgi:hypothetical protein
MKFLLASSILSISASLAAATVFTGNLNGQSKFRCFFRVCVGEARVECRRSQRGMIVVEDKLELEDSRTCKHPRHVFHNKDLRGIPGFTLRLYRHKLTSTNRHRLLQRRRHVRRQRWPAPKHLRRKPHITHHARKSCIPF